MNDYEWKELADNTIQEIEEFIDTESQFIKIEHKLLSALLGLDHVFAHLDELTPREHDLHQFLGEISHLLSEIKDIIESDETKEIKFKQEEERILDILEYAEEHRNWILVRQIKDVEKSLESNVIRLEKEELRELHAKFKKIKRFIQNLDINKTDQKVRYYLTKLIKILNAYERIFWHLLRKEQVIKKKLNRSK